MRLAINFVSSISLLRLYNASAQNSPQKTKQASEFGIAENLVKQIVANYRTARETKSPDAKMWLSLGSLLGMSRGKIQDLFSVPAVVLRAGVHLHLKPSHSRFADFGNRPLQVHAVRKQAEDKTDLDVSIVEPQSKTSSSMHTICVGPKDYSLDNIRCSILDVRLARKHLHEFYAGAPVQRHKITRCRISKSTAEHLLGWVAQSHSTLAASAANVCKGAKWQRPVCRNLLFLLYTADAQKHGVKPLKRSKWL